MRLQIGRLEIQAVEHPYKGVALFLRAISNRTVGEIETCAPACASAEQIACLIYINVARWMKAEAASCKRYFEELNLHLFQ